jgi:serine/threonine-protein kinase
MADDRDTRIGELAIKKGLLTGSQLRDVLRVQEEMRASTGNTMQLGDLLVQQGYLDAAQLQELLKTQARKATRELGGFTLISRLGAGGMGAVYKARQNSMDRMVALKVLPPKLAKDASFIERFFREARSVARLNHPNIVQGIDVGEASGYYYFAMEFVEGSSLRDMIQEQGTIGEAESLDIVSQVAQGLQHAHAHGLIHRDVKPDNVLLDKDGTAKVCDLGLARQTQEDSSLTQSGVALGTPHYISPEQARGDADMDARTDLYSLGATWFHMLAGRPPYVADNPLAVITKHLTEPPPKLSSARKGASRGIEAVIAKLMAKEPADRYQSAEELLKDIADLQAHRPPKLAGAAAAPAYVTARTRPPRVRDTRKHSPVSSRLHRPDLPDGVVLDDLAPEARPGLLSRRPVQIGLAAAVLAVAALATWGIRSAMTPPVVNRLPDPITSPDPVNPPDPGNKPADSKQRLTELEEMYQHILGTEKKNPDDFKLLEGRWNMLRKAGKGTKYRLVAMDKLRAIAARRKQLAQEAHRADLKRLEDFEKEVDKLTAAKKFAEALKKRGEFPADLAAKLPEAPARLDALEKRIRAGLKKSILAILAGAHSLLKQDKFPEARKALDELTTIGLPEALNARKIGLGIIDKAERALALKREAEARDRCRKALATIKDAVGQRKFKEALAKLDEAAKGLPQDALEKLVAPERGLIAKAQSFMKRCKERAAAKPRDVRLELQGVRGRITAYDADEDLLTVVHKTMGIEATGKGKLSELESGKLLELAGWSLPERVGGDDALKAGCFLALTDSFIRAKPYLERARKAGLVKPSLARALAVREKGEGEVLAQEKFERLQKLFASKDWRGCVALGEELVKGYAKTAYLQPLMPRVRQMLEDAQDAISPLVRYTVVLQEGEAVPELGIPAYRGTADTFLCSITRDQYPQGRSGRLKAFRRGSQVPLYHFDLSMLPKELRLEKALLEITCHSLGYGFRENTDKISVLAVKTSWVESGATWSFRARGTGLRWTEKGARKDIDTTTNWGLGANGKVAEATGAPMKPFRLDITRLAAAWLAGTRKNYGVYVRAEHGGIANLYAKEEPRQDFRPKLTLTFRCKRIRRAARSAFLPRAATVYSLNGEEEVRRFTDSFRFTRFTPQPGGRRPLRLGAGGVAFDVDPAEIVLIHATKRTCGDEFSIAYRVDCSGKKLKDRGHVAFGFSLNKSGGGPRGRGALACIVPPSRKAAGTIILADMARGLAQKPVYRGKEVAPAGKMLGEWHLRVSWKSPLLAWFVNGQRAGIVKVSEKRARQISDSKPAIYAGIFPSPTRDDSASLKISQIALGKPYDKDFEGGAALSELKEPERPPDRRPRPGPRPFPGPRR